MPSGNSFATPDLPSEIAEHMRAGSEERYRTLFDLAPVAVYSCDASGVIQDYNSRAAELFGRKPEVGDTDEKFCGSFRMYRGDSSRDGFAYKGRPRWRMMPIDEPGAKRPLVTSAPLRNTRQASVCLNADIPALFP